MSSDKDLAQIEAQLEAVRGRVRPSSQHLKSMAQPSADASSPVVSNLLAQITGPKSIYAFLIVTALATLKAAPRLRLSPKTDTTQPPRPPIVNATAGVLFGVVGLLVGTCLSRILPPTEIEKTLIAEYKPQLSKSIDEILHASVLKAKTQLIEGLGVSRLIGVAAVLMGLAAQGSKMRFGPPRS